MHLLTQINQINITFFFIGILFCLWCQVGIWGIYPYVQKALILPSGEKSRLETRLIETIVCTSFLFAGIIMGPVAAVGRLVERKQHEPAMEEVS